MKLKKRLDSKSAYSQLVILVFLPISILAIVSTYIVDKETRNATESNQQALATAALIRFVPIVKTMLPQIVDHHKADITFEPKNYEALNQHNPLTDSDFEADSSHSSLNLNIADQTLTVSHYLSDLRNQINLILASMSNQRHIQNVAILNHQGEIIASSDLQGLTLTTTQGFIDAPNSQQFIKGVETKNGTGYAYTLGHYNNDRYWLFIEMDNQPLVITSMRTWLILGLTGLVTLLILLLSLNIYSKSWIAPIYDLRLHLQRIGPDNMYQAVNTGANGELNLLQQDIIKTLRRLYGDFQELKDHADQTEDDLRDAFDEMEMQNILIREARDQAVSSSQAKSTFLANISHELRTPLNSIDGFINLLARHGNLTAEQDMYVQTICKSSAHLLALVNDVLDFSKIEAGKLVLDKHKFNLYAAIYDVMDMLSPLAAQKDLRMAVMYFNDVPNTIIGDELRVKQVLTNLVANAIKFTEVGEVVVRVSIDEDNHATQTTAGEALHELDDKQTNDELKTNDDAFNNDVIHIAIQDTGRGISEAAKTQLFKSFSQADPSITREYGGTGLGLIISKQLTMLMGGKIGFYDNERLKAVNQNDIIPINETSKNNNYNQTTSLTTQTKTGTTFWFNIPAQVQVGELDEFEYESADNDQDNLDFESSGRIPLPILHPFAQNQIAITKMTASAEVVETQLDHPPLKMLVWINHTTSLQVLKAALRPLSIEVSSANSLAGALECLKEEDGHWDWVIIDGGESSAHGDSAALLKQIRLHYQGKLAIYGYQVVLDASLLKRYQAFALHQPIDKRQLYHLLDTRTSRKSKMRLTPAWQGVTVLAVDDHLPNLLVLDALLDELGIKVVTASSGLEAIEKINAQIKQPKHILPVNDAISGNKNDDNDGTDALNGNNLKESVSKDTMEVKHGESKENSDANLDAIDLIFMDIQMPRMSGEETTRHIRQLESNYMAQNGGELVNKPKSQHQQSHKRIPIIALTAHGLTDEKDRLITTGFDDYVVKPISRPQLLQILQRWLGQGVETEDLIKPNHDTLDFQTLNQSAAADKLNDELADSTELASVNTNKVLDWQDALIRSANKPDLAVKLLNMMKDAATQDIKNLNSAWHDKNREQLAHIAHRILGASRYTGVPQIRQASQELEDKALLNVQHTVPSQFTMLDPYYQALIKSLEDLQNVDLDKVIADQQAQHSKTVSENDMNWKMI